MTTKSKTQQEKHKMSEIDENISKMFDIKKRLGKGAYGIVWKALDKRTNETVAVKKIFDAFRDETDAQRTFREIVFLKAFRNHPNVIRLLTVYRASNNLDIYLIFEYMESDLHNIIKKGTILKDIHKRYVMYQLINAIKYIHSGNVIHRDLKPSNVLIDSKCRCKLADFGLARSVSNRPMRESNDMTTDHVNEPILTDYVATRWYRAPEILVASKRYTKGIDMWSLGCILGEMIRGKPLFQGSSTVNQIERIVTALPEITDHDVKAVGAGFGSVLLSKQISRERKTSLNEMMSDAPEDALNMVKSLLVLDPLARLTAKQALGHPYVEKFRNSIPEIELSVDILPPFRDDVRLTVPEYRSKLYEIVQHNNEKSDKRHSTATAKGSNINQKDYKLSTSYDKTDPLKKPHRTKQGKISEDKYISKDKYLTRPEKHESETQPSISVPSINGKPTKKLTTISPNAKRKSGKTLSKYFAQQTVEVLKDKKHLKVHESCDDHFPVNVIDKRHSIDAGYASLPDGRIGLGGQLGELVGGQTTSPSGALKKIDSTRRQHRSSSSISKGEQKHKTEQATTHLLQHQQNKCSTHQKLECRQQESSFAYPDIDIEVQDPYNNDSAPFLKKPSYVRNSKSDVTNTIGSGLTKSTETIVRGNDRLCYEKRLKKLEEEIEKYKKEVKSFCKETFSYTHQKSPQKHSKGNGQIQSQIQNNFRNATNNQTRPHTQQQAYLERTKSDVRNNRHQQQIQQNLSNTKQNPYYDLLAKVTRDFGSKNGINSAIFNGTLNVGAVPIVTAENEGGEYIVDRSTKMSNKDVLIEEKHQSFHAHSNISKIHQPHQQSTHNIHRNGRPMSKFIARPAQHSSHLTKHTLTNCQ
ncbi:extracellular signal-regulated kinase 7 [Bactrocera dorsalis]|uniref:Mitogen-activated protein kinase n=1 Tax=Bactrocera dorsalis TaxID=27457 RepID=A0A6I9V8S6_BACDO|nr:extracellular signal-regulated kinase 7 [Bactrocera dorsalis]XP_011206274.2 extracellular signal-regulated kinase 7 [Bactrocera dorsalis]XP_011206275.2 extracellular signal-regulated kinase 7 [Bactrocera dorsalis]XP_029406975.2 extracellular signal-regulated kinase 7 [Bactrocera dorsalis]